MREEEYTRKKQWGNQASYSEDGGKSIGDGYERVGEISNLIQLRMRRGLIMNRKQGKYIKGLAIWTKGVLRDVAIWQRAGINQYKNTKDAGYRLRKKQEWEWKGLKPLGRLKFQELICYRIKTLMKRLGCFFCNQARHFGWWWEGEVQEVTSIIHRWCMWDDRSLLSKKECE